MFDPTFPDWASVTDDLGGKCPVQGTGTITLIPSGLEMPWYFRARGQHWSVTFGVSTGTGYVCPDGALLYVSGPSDDVRPYSAGYMEDHECKRHLTFALALFAAGITGEVEIPDPPDLLPPCVDCGAPTAIRVARIAVCSTHLVKWTKAFEREEATRE